MQERRTEVRMLCADMVEVTWKNHTGKRASVTGLLEDISPSGACLQLDDAVPLGVEIYWKSQENEFAGRVRYCVFREIGYFVGVEFTAGTRWSERSFRPQHLLDLQKLME
jgi:hypothetical protein